MQPNSSSVRPVLSPIWALVAVVSILALAWLGSRSPLGQRSVERIPDEPFPHVYVQSKVGEPSKCLVTDRAGATLRRSEPDTLGARWKCGWLEGPDGPVLSALTGKEPSYLFVPQAAVADPLLPLIYEKVRRTEELPLPKLRWVHLFFDRTYRGFYLQVRLPDKKWATNRDVGRAEILETVGDRAWCWNRKLRSACALWNEAFIAEALFPSPASSAGLDLLAAMLAEADPSRRAGRSFILTQDALDESYLWPWPLPFDLHRQLSAADGVRRMPDDVGSGLSYSDARYRNWSVMPEDSEMPESAEGADWASRLRSIVGEPETDGPTMTDFVRAAGAVEPVGSADPGPSTPGLAERAQGSPAADWLPRGES